MTSPGRARVRCLAIAVSLCAVLLASMTGCDTHYDRDAAGKLSMRPSVTWLFLLRRTPFFTALSTRQLQWVIQHSKEWKVSKGTVIDRCGDGRADADYWILLDGEWAVEQGDKVARAGRSDPGKWFSRTILNGGSCRLVATASGYVMKITNADMQEMLAKGFDFNAQLSVGRIRYQDFFGTRKDE